VAVITGSAFTVTLKVAIAVHPEEPVTVTEYVPVAEAEVFVTDGFCNELLKPFGPAQE
jgi:hypothetical protein